MNCYSPFCIREMLKRWWKGFCWLSCQFGTPTKSALIAALALIFVNWGVIPAAQLRQVRLDRQYKVLTEVAVTNARYYQGIWNVYFGKTTGEEEAAKRQYREDVQKTSTDAERIILELA